MDKIEVGEVFSISDHTGEEQDVEVLGVMNIDGIEYVAVAFVEDIQNEEEEDMDIFFMKIDVEGDLADIDSDEEFDKVTSAFEEFLDGQEDIE